MSSRKARAAKANNEPVPEVQVTDYAFNTLGWAVELPKIDGQFMKPTVINAYQPSTTPWMKAAEKIKNEGGDPWRSSLALTPREANQNQEVGVVQYMLIGITNSNGMLPEHLNKPASRKKQKPVGTAVLNELTLTFDKLPLMVVTPIQDKEQMKTDLYVLLRAKSDLCIPHTIGQNSCFYLPDFRDNTTNSKDRGPAWNQLVTNMSRVYCKDTLSQKQEIFKKARNTTKIILNPRLSLQNEVSCHAASFNLTGDMWQLQELNAVLEQAMEDLVDEPPSYPAMRRFVDFEEDLEENDAALLVEEVGKLWPELQIDATDIPLLKGQLSKENIYLEYRLVKPFLAEACFQIRNMQGLDDQFSIARDALATVKRVLGSSESTVPVLTPNTESLLIPSIIATLKNMLEAANKFDNGLKDNCGDQTNAETLHDVWEKYADALDTDAAKKSWFEAARLLTTAYKQKHRGLAEMIGDLVEVLDHIKIDELADKGRKKSLGGKT